MAAPNHHPHFRDSPDRIDMVRAEKTIKMSGTLSFQAFGMTLTMMPVILGYPAVFVLMIGNVLG